VCHVLAQRRLATSRMALGNNKRAFTRRGKITYTCLLDVIVESSTLSRPRAEYDTNSHRHSTVRSPHSNYGSLSLKAFATGFTLAVQELVPVGRRGVE
jgi:hypothetical protein